MIFRLASLLIALMMLPANAADIRTCFTPGGDCTGLIVAEVANAKREVLVQAYSFTSPDIVKALVDAKRRGVDVQVILDKSQTGQKKEGIAADTLIIAKVPVLIDSAHSIAHNKVMVLDSARVITGSFNYTRAAQERNAENVLVIADSDLARRYADNWRHHSAHSGRYESR